VRTPSGSPVAPHSPRGKRRAIGRAAAAIVLVLGLQVLALRLTLSASSSLVLLPFVFGALALLGLFGRWLTRSARLAGAVVATGALPVLGVLYGGWFGLTDLVLSTDGTTVTADVTHEDSYEQKSGGTGYRYVIRYPDGKTATLDPGVGTRFAVGSRTDVVRAPDDSVNPGLPGAQSPAFPLVLAGLGAVAQAAGLVGVALLGERRRVRNATTR